MVARKRAFVVTNGPRGHADSNCWNPLCSSVYSAPRTEGNLVLSDTWSWAICAACDGLGAGQVLRVRRGQLPGDRAQNCAVTKPGISRSVVKVAARIRGSAMPEASRRRYRVVANTARMNVDLTHADLPPILVVRVPSGRLKFFSRLGIPQLAR